MNDPGRAFGPILLGERGCRLELSPEIFTHILSKIELSPQIFTHLKCKNEFSLDFFCF